MQDLEKTLLLQQPYCSYYILSILDHRMFEKIKDYSTFEKAIKGVSDKEFERLAGENKNEEAFKGFLRYVNMQENESEKKKQG